MKHKSGVCKHVGFFLYGQVSQRIQGLCIYSLAKKSWFSLILALHSQHSKKNVNESISICASSIHQFTGFLTLSRQQSCMIKCKTNIVHKEKSLSCLALFFHYMKAVYKKLPRQNSPQISISQRKVLQPVCIFFTGVDDCITFTAVLSVLCCCYYIMSAPRLLLMMLKIQRNGFSSENSSRIFRAGAQQKEGGRINFELHDIPKELFSWNSCS